MCGADEPATVADALAMLDRALAALAGADAGSLPRAVGLVFRRLDELRSRRESTTWKHESRCLALALSP